MNLAQARKRAGLTQADLATKARTERAHISRIEAYEQNLSDDMARRLAPHLGVDEENLMWGHFETSMDACMERLSSLPDTSAKKLVGSTTFSDALKALRALMVNEEVPAEVVWLAAKTTKRLVGIAEEAAKSEARPQGRDIFGRRIRV